MRKVVDGNGDGKLSDEEIGVLFAKVNTTGDGMLTKHQLVWLCSGLGIQVSAAYVNYLWAENKDQDEEYMTFVNFKRLLQRINPKYDQAIKQARPG